MERAWERSVEQFASEVKGEAAKPLLVWELRPKAGVKQMREALSRWDEKVRASD